MIVNGKLYTIFDEIENKPLPVKEECIMVEKNVAKARKEARESVEEFMKIIDEKFTTFDKDTKRYFCGLLYSRYK